MKRPREHCPCGPNVKVRLLSVAGGGLNVFARMVTVSYGRRAGRLRGRVGRIWRVLRSGKRSVIRIELVTGEGVAEEVGGIDKASESGLDKDAGGAGFGGIDRCAAEGGGLASGLRDG